MLGEGEGKGGRRKTKLAGGGGGAKKRSLKLGEKFEGAFGVKRRVPKVAERGRKFRRGGEPKRDGGGGLFGGRVSGEGERNGKVVGEGAAKAGGEGTKVGGVMKDRDRGSRQRGRKEGRRNKGTIETRRVRELTGGVSSNVVVRMFVVWDLSNRKT